jgi:predicted ATPase
MMRLKSLYLSGFKSFRSEYSLGRPADATPSESRRLEFGDITVLLGANGAGKSNVVAFFRMLGFLTTGALQEYVGRGGGADSILYYGLKTTPRLDAEVVFEGDDSRDTYSLTLVGAPAGGTIFTSEQVTWEQEGRTAPWTRQLGAGHVESQLLSAREHGDRPSGVVLSLLQRCRPYQFHDTTPEAKIRNPGYLEDADYLRADGGNLAAYLRTMRLAQREYYDRIVRTIRQVCPQFEDFVLEPSPQNPRYIVLNWRATGRADYLMGPHQLSDGTLRFMAMATLMLQPPERLPLAIILDEPELGLHPAAIAVLADLVRGAATRCQVVLATQSPTLVNHFPLEQIQPVEFRGDESLFLDFRPDDFKDWLEDYTTGELWQKDVFGGGPRHG